MSLDLDSLKKELENYRLNRKKKRGALPSHFWEKAIELGKGIGYAKVARTLRLDSTKLKRLVHGTSGSDDIKVVKVNLSRGSTSPSPNNDFVAEVIGPNGMTIRLRDTCGDRFLTNLIKAWGK